MIRLLILILLILTITSQSSAYFGLYGTIEYQNKISRLYAPEAYLSSIYEKEKEAFYEQNPILSEDQVYAPMAQHFKKKNLAEVAFYLAYKPAEKSFFTHLQAEELLKDLIEHPVVGRDGQKLYADQSKTGFCFGRALYVERKLHKAGVSKNLIRKVFVLGDLTNGRSLWDYHVATMVLTQNAGWVLIDSLFNRVYGMRDWYGQLTSLAVDPAHPLMRLYITESEKFQAAPGVFITSHIFNPVYKNYFFDLSVQTVLTAPLFN